MTKRHALDLSLDGIRLLPSADEPDYALGHVNLDDPDFAQRVTQLRLSAETEAGPPLIVDLIIPASEILYTKLAAPGDTEAARQAAVRDGLEGLTPYALDELVYDWSDPADAATKARDGTALVAAVARETLEEAEHFALTYGFDPRGFTAHGDARHFVGRPDFGPTVHAAAESVRRSGRDDELKENPHRQGIQSAPPSADETLTTLAAVHPREADRPSKSAVSASAGSHQSAPVPTDTPDMGRIFDEERVGPAADEPDQSPEATAGVPQGNGGIPRAADRASASAATTAAGSLSRAHPPDVPPLPKKDAGRKSEGARGAGVRADGTPPLADGSSATERSGTQPGPDETPAPATASAEYAGKVAEARSDESGLRFASRRSPAERSNGPPDPDDRQSRLGSIASRIAMLPDGGGGPPRPGREPLLNPGKPLSPELAPATSVGTTENELRPAVRAPGPKPPQRRPTSRRPGSLPDVSRAAASLTPVGAPGVQERGTPPAGGDTDRARRPIGGGVRQAALSSGFAEKPGASFSPSSGTRRPALGKAASDGSGKPVDAVGPPGLGREQLALRPRVAPAVLPVAVGLIVAALLAVGIWTILLRLAPSAGDAPDLTEATPSTIEAARDFTSSTAPAGVAPLEEDDAVLATEEAMPGAIPPPESGIPTQDPLRSPQSEGVQGQDVDIAALPPGMQADVREPLDPLPDDENAPVNVDPLQRPAGASEGAARYAATGIDARAPETPNLPDAGRLDDAIVTRLDPDVAPRSPASLTDPPRVNPPAPAQASPNPMSSPDAIGGASDIPTASPPTPEDGIRDVEVTSGAPPVRPPTAPNRPAGTPETAALDQATDAAVTEAISGSPDSPDSTPQAEPATEVDALGTGQTSADPRPVLRPGSIGTRDAASEGEDSSTAATRISDADIAQAAPAAPGQPPADEAVAPSPDARDVVPDPDPEVLRLAAIRPPSRPAVISPPIPDAPDETAIARQQVQADEATNAAVAAAMAAVANPPQPQPVPSAVARSTLPEARPGQVTQGPQRVAAAAATVRPSGPSNATVSTRATQQNVLRLSEVNLIGVYGNQTNRRALVRLPNGRFVKVKVGDAVDGGRVRSIGDSQLRYVKGGRDLILTLPKG